MLKKPVVKVKGGGGTDPADALKKALELKPDVIYETGRQPHSG